MTALLDEPSALIAAGVVGRMEDGSSRWYVDPVTGEKLERVTTILGAALNKVWAIPWASKVTAELAVEYGPAMPLMLLLMGEQNVLNWLKDEAKRRRELASRLGVHQHDVLEALLLDQPIPELPADLVGAVVDGAVVDHDAISDGLLQFITDYEITYRHIVMSEATVAHPGEGYRYAGTLDTVLIFMRGVSAGLDHPSGRKWLIEPGTLALGDLKSGKYLPEMAGPQLEAYRRCPEVWLTKDGDKADMPWCEARFVLHLRREFPGGYRLHVLDESKADRHWARFLHARALLAEEGEDPKWEPVGYPVEADGSHPSPLVADQFALRAPVRQALIHGAACTRVHDLTVLSEADLLSLDGVGDAAVADIQNLAGGYGLALRVSWLIADQVRLGKGPRKALAAGGVATVQDLTSRTAGDLLAMKGIGAAAVEQIRAWLTKEHGLYLAGETPEVVSDAVA